jgi:hypothetical protein
VGEDDAQSDTVAHPDAVALAERDTLTLAQDEWVALTEGVTEGLPLEVREIETVAQGDGVGEDDAQSDTVAHPVAVALCE